MRRTVHPTARPLPALVALGLLLAAPSTGSAAGGFTDVTEGSGVDFVHTFGDDEMSNLVESTGVGLCLFDYDGDDRLDLYLVNGANLAGVSDPPEEGAAAPTNRLYRNVTEAGGPWRFEDVTEAAGVGDPGFGMGCVTGDLDGDGDPDLVVTNYGPNAVFRNDGRDASGAVRFTDVTEETGLGDPSWSLGATLLDYDGDGRLDLYVGNYVRFDPDYRAFYATDRFPGPLAYPGSPDRLWRNVTEPGGPWRFEEVTEAAGVGRAEGRAMGVAAADFDDDGDPDLFVANDAMANFLFRNERGDGGSARFEDVALTAGVAFSENGEATAAMGVDFGDVDGDGRMDVLIPDMTFSTLYQAGEGQTFRDRSRLWGLARAAAQYVGWSGHLLDFDSDGRLDLFMTTGDLHDLEPQEDLLLRNLGGGHLEDVSLDPGMPFHRPTMGRGAAVGDVDGDGDPDLVMNVLAGPPVLLRNDVETGNHWLVLRLVGRSSNRDAVGARVTVETPAGTQVREVLSASGYLSSGDRRLHFGLGEAEEASRITIRWPSGRVETLEHVAGDRYLTVEEAP